MLCSEGGRARGRLLDPKVEDGGPRGGLWEPPPDVISRGRVPPLAEGGTPFRSRPVVEAKIRVSVREEPAVFEEGGGSHTQPSMEGTLET